MQKRDQSQKFFIFIKPYTYDSPVENIGIPFLCGQLEKSDYQAIIIDYQKKFTAISSSERKAIINPLKKDLKKKKQIDNYFFPFFSDFFVSTFPEEIWSATNKFDKKIEKIFLKNLNDYNKARYIGISVASSFPLLFSLRLAQYIKNHCKNNPKIIFGGFYITENYKNLIPVLEKNPIIDYLVIGEGEPAIYSLVNRKKINEIPGLIYLDNNHYEFSKNLIHNEDINNSMPPIFDISEKEKFLQASKKCYWGKCAFCVADTNKNTPNFSTKDPKKIIEDIRTNIDFVNKKNNKFTFTDSALKTGFIEKLSKELAKKENIDLIKDANLKLGSYLRFEKNIDYSLLSKARAAGFCFFIFGLETSIPRLLKLVNKGIELSSAFRILDACSKLGIMADIQLIIGLPTQTKKELLKDLFFIKKILEKYSNTRFFVKPFMLLSGSPIFNHPKKYKIKIVQKTLPFQKINRFKQLKKNALSPKDAVAIFKDFFSKEIKNKEKNKRIYLMFDDSV